MGSLLFTGLSFTENSRQGEQITPSKQQRIDFKFNRRVLEDTVVSRDLAPANQIARNMSPDGALNHVKDTLPCIKFLNARQSSDSRAQECKGHTLSTETLRSHVTRDYTVLTHLGKANNGLNRR